MIDPSLTVAWFQTPSVGISESVALAATATLAYLFGRGSKSRLQASGLEGQAQAERELQRAASIALDLEHVAAAVRKDLAAHHQSVVQFKSKVAMMASGEAATSCKDLHEEAERILAPTLRLAAQLSHAYDRIRQQSTQLQSFTEGRTDPLTGVSTRRALDDQLKLFFEMLCRNDRPFSLTIFDIDNFKDINEKRGRGFGDLILQDVARLFDQTIRDTDFVARYGGEEFVVVMPQTRLAGASVFGERLRGLVEQQVKCTVSGGIAEATSQDSIQSLLSRADSALYSAKVAGRNAVFQHCGTSIRPVERQCSGSRGVPTNQFRGDPSEEMDDAADFPDIKGHDTVVITPSMQTVC